MTRVKKAFYNVNYPSKLVVNVMPFQQYLNFFWTLGAWCCCLAISSRHQKVVAYNKRLETAASHIINIFLPDDIVAIAFSSASCHPDLWACRRQDIEDKAEA